MSEPLYASPTNEFGMASLVFRKPAGGFAVVLQDVDAGEYVPRVTSFPELADAIEHARALVEPRSVKGLEFTI